MKARRTIRIARWETMRSTGSAGKRTGVAIVVLIVVLGMSTPILLAVNPTPDAGLYRVGVSEHDPYYSVVNDDPTLRAIPPDPDGLETGSLDVLLAGGGVHVADSEKSRAASDAFRESTMAYNDRLMDAESDEAAAFPVAVTLAYRAQAVPTMGADGRAADAGANEATEIESTTSGDSETQDEPESSDRTEPSTDDPNEIDGGSTERRGSGIDEPTRTDESDGGGSIPSAPFGGTLGSAQSGTPSSIAPPFPLRSLILAFVFLLPFNLIIQAYGSSVIAERINRRGELLLVSPATRGDIVVGKTIPYLLLSIAITTGIALAIGGGWLSVAAVSPLAALFLAATFLAAMLARSYKELTFLTVTISVGLTAYAFIPAVFADVHPIAAISPLTIVVYDLQSTSVEWGQFVFSTLPVGLVAAVLFHLGVGIYREEDMFTQLPFREKVLDALAAPLSSTWKVGLWTALFIPFVLVLELAAVAILYVLPGRLSIPILLATLAVIEETAKSVHVFSGFERSRFDRSPKTAILLGTISGVGFFLGEKLLVITQLVGLPELELGRVAFGPAVLGISPAVLLAGPLLLHTVTASIGAIGASRSRRWYAVSLVGAVLVHLAYNLGVVSVLA
ncbi:MAG: ABC transporter permease subunit [Halodesulfurarchaeum sp.]